MKKTENSCLLVVGKRSCVIALSDESSADRTAFDFQDGEIRDQLEAIVTALLPMLPPSKQIVIGLDSSLCLPVTIGAASPQMLRKPRIMHYHLEEWLPWSAEDFVSDFVSHRNSAFAVALETNGVLELAQALREAGVDIAAMSPLPLLALNGLQDQSRLPRNCLVAWQHGNQIDLMTLKDSKPFACQQVVATEADLLNHLSLSRTELSEETPVVPVQLAEDMADVLVRNEVPVADAVQMGVLTAGIDFCQKITSGSREPSIDLQRDALAGLRRNQRLRFEWTLLGVAVLASACLVSAALWLKAQEFEQAQQVVDSQLEELYREVTPDGPMPNRVSVAISGEHRRLKGSQETPKKLPVPAAADVVLEKMLKLFPARLRFRVPEITVDHKRITIGAEVRSNADADLIASSLRDGGFEIKAPRTRRLTDKGFGARINGELVDGDLIDGEPEQ